MNPQHTLDMQPPQVLAESSNTVQAAQSEAATEQKADVECSGGACQIVWKPLRAGIPTG